jgi:Anti-sigma factor NepR
LLATIQEQAEPLIEGGNMNGKNGFTGPTGPSEAQMEGQSGGRRRVRQPVGKRPAGCAEADLEMEARPDMQGAPRHDSQATGMIDRSLQAQLGRQLRAIFEGIEEEPVPERFVKLLEALEAREKQR